MWGVIAKVFVDDDVQINEYDDHDVEDDVGKGLVSEGE